MIHTIQATPRTNAMLLKTFKGEVEHDGLAAIVDLARKLECDLLNLTAIHKKLCHAVKNASYKSITLDQQKWHMEINDILGESGRLLL